MRLKRYGIPLGLLWCALGACAGSQSHTELLPPPASHASVSPSGSEAAELALLQLEKLTPDTPITLADTSVVAGSAYMAASGRTCRYVDFTHDAQRSTRLACRDAKRWFYVPMVEAQASAVDHD